MNQEMDIAGNMVDVAPPKRVNKTADKKKYMREYMARKYANDWENQRAYKNSQHCKKNNLLTNDDWKKYGKYLCHIHKLRIIRKALPPNVFQMGLEEPVDINVVIGDPIEIDIPTQELPP